MTAYKALCKYVLCQVTKGRTVSASCRGPDLPRGFRGAAFLTTNRFHRHTRRRRRCKLFKSISKRAVNQGTDLPSCRVPRKEMEFSLRRLWPPEPSHAARGPAGGGAAPSVGSALPGAQQQASQMHHRARSPHAQGSWGRRFRAGQSPRCELSHICVSCHQGLCEKRAALKCHPRLEATSRACTWDSMVTCQAT